MTWTLLLSHALALVAGLLAAEVVTRAREALLERRMREPAPRKLNVKRLDLLSDAVRPARRAS